MFIFWLSISTVKDHSRLLPNCNNLYKHNDDGIKQKARSRLMKGGVHVRILKST